MTTPHLERLQNFTLPGYVGDYMRESSSNYGQAFGGLLLHQDSIFQTSPRRCYDLLSALTDADLIHRCSYPQPGGRDKLESLVDYALEYSSSRGMDGSALGSKIEFHQWLQCVWKGGFSPTFYFPSNMTGPDFVFCLRHQQKRNERLICAVQVNTLQSTNPSISPFHTKDSTGQNSNDKSHWRRLVQTRSNVGSQPLV